MTIRLYYRLASSSFISLGRPTGVEMPLISLVLGRECRSATAGVSKR